MFSRSSIFGAAVESSAPFQLIDSMTAEMIAARATTAAVILAMGRRLENNAGGILLKLRRDALPGRATPPTRGPRSAIHLGFRPPRGAPRGPLPPSSRGAQRYRPASPGP